MTKISMQLKVETDNFDRQWEVFLQMLHSDYGISSALYLVLHVTPSLSRTYSAMVPSLWATSYSSDYIKELGIESILKDDYTVRHCAEIKKPILWMDDSYLARMTLNEVERWRADEKAGMSVGVSIPIMKSSNEFCGGFGFASDHLNPKEFEEFWLERGEALTAFAHQFDACARKPLAIKTYGLSTQEIAVLTYVAAGMASEQVGHHLNLAKRTVEGYLLSARRKTKSQNTVEAVAKAISFGII